MLKTVLVFKQIDPGVYKGGTSSPIKGYMAVHVDLYILITLSFKIVAKEMCILKYKIRLKRHLFFLKRCQKVSVVDIKAFTRASVHHFELGITCLFHEHHPP